MRVDAHKTPIVGKPIIHSVIILDCSSSMGGAKWDNACSAINEEVDTLSKDDTADYKLSVVCFSSQDKREYTAWMYPLIPGSHLKELMFPNGMTALNDIIVEVIAKLELAVHEEENVVLKIFTDGQENASRQSFQVAAQSIQLAKSKNWVVTFIGTQYDVERSILQYGVDSTNTLVHNNTGADFGEKMRGATYSTVNYASRVSKGDTNSKGFFTTDSTTTDPKTTTN